MIPESPLGFAADVGGRAMPVHDWTRVDAGIFHAFHHRWISAISDVLNEGILPEDYYALPEQHAAGFDNYRADTQNGPPRVAAVVGYFHQY